MPPAVLTHWRAFCVLKDCMGLSHHSIGILFSTDGPYGLVGRAMLNGARLAVEEVNAQASISAPPASTSGK